MLLYLIYRQCLETSLGFLKTDGRKNPAASSTNPLKEITQDQNTRCTFPEHRHILLRSSLLRSRQQPLVADRHRILQQLHTYNIGLSGGMSPVVR